jgi:hypothetical protein
MLERVKRHLIIDVTDAAIPELRIPFREGLLRTIMEPSNVEDEQVGVDVSISEIIKREIQKELKAQYSELKDVVQRAIKHEIIGFKGEIGEKTKEVCFNCPGDARMCADTNRA